VKRENNTITAQKTREKRQVAGSRTTRPERKSGRYPRNLKVPARHNVSTSAPPRASAARHRRHFQDQENHWDLVACGSPERGDAVIGRSITYDRDDAPRGFGELDAECRRHGKAKTASGSKVVAAGFPHRQPAPEEVGRRSRLIQVDGVTGRRCSDNVEDCVGQQRPWADLRGRWSCLRSGRRAVRLAHIVGQSLKRRTDVPDDRITDRRAGRLLRIRDHGNKFSPRWEIRSRFVLMVAEDGRADNEDQVVPAQRCRNSLDRGR
jgi:hypothetical protein